MFAKTRIEIADFHTTLSYFANTPPIANVLPLSSQSTYNDLYQRVCNEFKGLEYQNAAGSQASNVFLRLKPFFSAEKFWRRYFQTGQQDTYPKLAWEFQVPLKVLLSPRVEYIPDPQFPCKVSPILTVLLFPFGWSTWLSLLINSSHDLISLSSFVRRVFTARTFRLSGSQIDISLQQLFDLVADGTMSDAFAGPETNERSAQDFFVTTTVLAKQVGSLSSSGLSSEEQRALKQIVRPNSLPNSKKLQEQIKDLKIEIGDPLLNFMCTDEFGRFI
jgi:hypothetical protein